MEKKYNENYVKTTEQLLLEQLIGEINSRNLSIMTMKTFDKDAKDASEISILMNKFDNTLVSCIVSLTNESVTRNLISDIAQKYGVRYDEELRRYDTYFEVISMAYSGLYQHLKKGTNKGKLRLEVLLEKPEYFYQTLREYIQNNICRDYRKRLQKGACHEMASVARNKDGEEVDKLDYLYNGNGKAPIVDSVETQVLDMNQLFKEEIICSMLDMFWTTHAERAYIAGLVFLSEYDVNKVVYNLSHKNFDELIMNMLDDLEESFQVDLAAYKVMKPRTGKFLRSFREVPKDVQINRIYRLKNMALSTVVTIPACNEAKRYYCWKVA